MTQPTTVRLVTEARFGTLLEAEEAAVIPGGTTGQILAKASGTDYDTEWADAPTGGDSDITVLDSAETVPGGTPAGLLVRLSS
jgi:hypothetical protein